MRSEASPKLNDQDRLAEAPEVPVPPSLVNEAVTVTEDASQRMTLWLEQTLAAQMLVFKRHTVAQQAAANALLEAHDTRRMFEVRDTLFAVVLEGLARWQGEIMDAWCSLQRNLARRSARTTATATEELLAFAPGSHQLRTAKPSLAPQDTVPPASVDDVFKAWERLWLPWTHSAEAPSRA